ncbi:LysM peptidoglycan-binding domain-containing protein [Paraferrimonas sp. SM1919]|uniref:lytic transglycosylase n=1 Tax=Paraferrimonas sp. SM1919 TaxID=2662263 RepID=UPI0013D33109|nr:LysM peptidoglycan-binding domain-containing protein [Paraferrimonas sp. SM1919]
MKKLVSPSILLMSLLSGCQSVDVIEADNSQLTALEAENASPPVEEPEQQLNEQQPEVVITDAWQRVSSQLTFDVPENARVNHFVKWYQKHPSHLQVVTKRAEPYLHMIVEKIEQRGLPLELAFLPIVESSFDAFAYSHGSASGMWQFTAATGKHFGLEINWWYDGRRDVFAATDAALDMMEYLYKRMDNNWLYALAAYNTGEGRIFRAISKNKKQGKAYDFWSLDLPKETERYVPQMLALTKVFRDPAKYGLTISPVANQQKIVQVDVGSQIDLSMAAELASISLKELQQLNPGYNRWATSPTGPHNIVIPIEKEAEFKQKLALLPDEKRLKWVRYQIESGDSIGEIANKHYTTIDVIRSVNQINGNQIIAGKHLLIPVAAKDPTQYQLSVDQRLAKKQSIKRAKFKKNYLVKSGDSLWSIAKAHKVNVSALARWNSMAPRDTLTVGKTLVIWNNLGASKSNGVLRKVHYKIRKGDSLARIASKFNVSVSQIKRWNSFKGKYIQPGDMLTLYVDVTQVSS